MAVEKNLHPMSFVAGADLRSYQYCFVKLGSTQGQVALCGDGEDAIGVLQDNPNTGQACAVQTTNGSSTKVKAGATAITIGTKIASGANGVAVPAGTNDFVVGRALSASTTTGTIIEVLLDKEGQFEKT